MTLRSQEIQQTEVVFLKIKVSTPNKPNSSIFEKLEFCVLSLAVAQRGLDVVAKLKGIETDNILAMIREYGLENIVQPVNATPFFETPLVYSPFQKDIGLYCVRCKNKVEEIARTLVSCEALQVYYTDDEYNIWSIFAFDKIALFNQMMNRLFSPKLQMAIEDSTLYAVLEVRKTTEARVDRLASDIDNLIENGKYGKGYWPALLNILRLLLYGPRTKRSIAAKLNISEKHTERCLSILKQRKSVRIVGREGAAAIYDLNNEKFKRFFSYLRE